MEILKQTGYILRDLKEPIINIEEVSYFPETVGWKVLFVLLVVFSIYKIKKSIEEWKINQYRREASQEISKLNDYSYDSFKKLSKVLSVTANYALNNTGTFNKMDYETKVEFLNKSCNNSCFESKLYILWQDSLLKKREQFNLSKNDFEEIKKSILFWIKNHKRGNL